jgi:hypothetical protein
MNRPVPGIKRISRLDTGEFVKDEPMTDEDRQQNLFTEVQDIEKLFLSTDPRPESKTEVKPDVPIPPPTDDPPADTRGIH